MFFLTLIGKQIFAVNHEQKYLCHNSLAFIAYLNFN